MNWWETDRLVGYTITAIDRNRGYAALHRWRLPQESGDDVRDVLYIDLWTDDILDTIPDPQ